MTIRVRLFAGLTGLVGSRDLLVTLPAGATVGALRERLVQDYPVLDAFMNTLVCAVDEEVQPAERVLRDGDLVDVIPPISGGAA